MVVAVALVPVPEVLLIARRAELEIFVADVRDPGAEAQDLTAAGAPDAALLHQALVVHVEVLDAGGAGEVVLSDDQIGALRAGLDVGGLQPGVAADAHAADVLVSLTKADVVAVLVGVGELAGAAADAGAAVVLHGEAAEHAGAVRQAGPSLVDGVDVDLAIPDGGVEIVPEGGQRRAEALGGELLVVVVAELAAEVHEAVGADLDPVVDAAVVGELEVEILLHGAVVGEAEGQPHVSDVHPRVLDGVVHLWPGGVVAVEEVDHRVIGDERVVVAQVQVALAGVGLVAHRRRGPEGLDLVVEEHEVAVGVEHELEGVGAVLAPEGPDFGPLDDEAGLGQVAEIAGVRDLVAVAILGVRLAARVAPGAAAAAVEGGLAEADAQAVLIGPAAAADAAAVGVVGGAERLGIAPLGDEALRLIAGGHSAEIVAESVAVLIGVPRHHALAAADAAEIHVIGGAGGLRIAGLRDEALRLLAGQHADGLVPGAVAVLIGVPSGGAVAAADAAVIGGGVLGADRGIGVGDLGVGDLSVRGEGLGVLLAGVASGAVRFDDGVRLLVGGI